jgi:VWFA-related protein
MFTIKAVRTIRVLTIFSLLPSAALTQSQNPSQTPAPPAPVVSTQGDVVRVTTELVQTDVSVIDKQGHFVDGLSRDKFELLVDGKPQPIAFFERVAAGSSKEAALVASASKASAPPSDGKTATSAPASSTVSDRGRTTLFFIDDLHLSPGSMKRTQDLLLKFVNQGIKPKDQALIGTASGQLGFLQQVTDSRDVLRTAIDRLRYRPGDIADTLTSPPMNEYQAIAIENNNRDALGYFTDKQCDEFKRMGRGSCAPDTGMTNNAVYDDATARNRSGGGTTGTSPGPVVFSEGTGRRGQVSNQLRPEAERMVRARARMIASLGRRVTLNTLNSLESLIRSAAGVPERKVVIFISDGFLLNLASTSAYDLRRITDAALRSGVVIYTIDARGLVGGGPDASTKDGLDTTGKFTRLTMSEITALQEGLNALANDTGGRAWRNSNDLGPGIGRALEETSAYYLLAWRPEGPAQTRDGFRRIEVKIKDRPDLTVRVRSGFFAKDPADIKTSETTGNLSIDDQLLAAIRAAYPRQGMPLALSLGYLDKANEGIMVAASVQVDLSEQPGAEKTTGESDLNVIGAVVDEAGNILSSLKQKVTIPAGDAVTNGSIVLTLQFPKVAPGLRQVRIAAHDSKSGRLGSMWQWIDIPNLSSAGLTLSSIFLTDGSTPGSQKPIIKPDGRFTQSAKLRFQTYVYNAASAGSKPNLVLQLELRRDGQTVIQTPPSPVTTEGVSDLTRIPVVGEFPLASFPPGQYELSLLVTDKSSNKGATQRTTFSIR